MTGQGSEFGGAHRFERPIDACELAQGLENTPQRRVSVESNNRNFLILGLIQTLEQWTSAYPRINTITAIRRYKQIHRRDVYPINKRLIRTI